MVDLEYRRTYRVKLRSRSAYLIAYLVEDHQHLVPDHGTSVGNLQVRTYAWSVLSLEFSH
jgi:hypothetical protein